jgi:oligosaccharide reducing-end xylanase
MAINAFTTGPEGPVKVADDFNAKVQDAKNSNGWCVFLTHAINGDQGYSPTQSTDLASHLAFVNANSGDYWVAPFKTVAKYIKERNAATFSETTITTDSLKVTITDNLDNTIYNEAITIRRALPSGWRTPMFMLEHRK